MVKVRAVNDVWLPRFESGRPQFATATWWLRSATQAPQLRHPVRPRAHPRRRLGLLRTPWRAATCLRRSQANCELRI